MKLDEISNDYGIDTAIAFRNAYSDRKIMLENVTRFLKLFGDVNYSYEILFISDKNEINRYIAAMANCAATVGAYILHNVCDKIIDSEYVSVELAADLKRTLNAAVEFWKLYLPTRYAVDRDKFAESAVELYIAVKYGFLRNVEYIIDSMKAIADTESKKFLLREIKGLLVNNDYDSVLALLDSYKNRGN